MLSGADFNSKVEKTMLKFINIDAKTSGGGGNLVVDGAGNGSVKTEADDTVVLIADGADFVEMDSNLNQLEIQGGINDVVINGNNNISTANNSNNRFTSRGHANVFSTNNGNNVFDSVGDYNTILAQNGITSVSSMGDNNKVYTNNSATTVYSAGNENKIYTDNGNSEIHSGGDKNEITALNGDQVVYSSGFDYSTGTFGGAGNGNTIITGNGNDYVISIGNNNIVSTNDGDDYISSSGNSNTLKGGDGDDIIKTVGNYNTVTATGGNNYISSKGNDNDISTGFGNDNISSLGDNNTILSKGGHNRVFSDGEANSITTGAGHDQVLALGNKNYFDLGDGNDDLVFYGNDIEFHLGNGDSRMQTLDFAIKNQNENSAFNYAAYEDRLAENTSVEVKSTKIGEIHDYSDITVQEPDATAIQNAGSAVPEGVYMTTAITQDIINKLDSADKAIVGNYNFNETVADGSPKYIIAQGKATGGYFIYQYQGPNHYYAVRGWSAVGNGNGHLYLNSQTEEKELTTNYSAVKTTTNRFSDIDVYHIAGVKNVKGTIGTGSNNIKLNVSENLTIDGQTIQKDENGQYVNNNPNTYNNIFVTGEIVAVDENSLSYHNEEVGTEKLTAERKDKYTVTNSSYRTSDPIIVDFNRDGKVSFYESSNSGVDINNDGIANGNATNGDKMLVMSDMNNNGKIDGTEVFGDNTVNPFTGEALHAKDGFDALRLVAEEAQKRGFNCISDGMVNLANLKAALQTVGVDLGFISDENVTTLEDLAHVSQINVKKYSGRNEETGEIQIGSYVDNQGKEYKALDVWAKL